jgi:hypothetical protein
MLKIIPTMVCIARAPRYKTEVRLTKTYTNIQKTARVVRTRVSNRNSKNCGMVYILYFKNTGRKNFPTMISVAAAIHSYVAMPNPIAYPEPDMPINCSAEILEAINEEPTAHQVRVLPAKK